MTAPTHAAFGVLWAAIAGTSQLNAIACALGALLPDIDHPQSSIGRIFFFLSHPINTRFGHRGLIHGFVLWLPLLVVAAIAGSTTIQWIILGAISHILIDASNSSGVRALTPFTDRTLVCFKRDWRIKTGSVQEIFVFITIFGLISLMNYSYTLGGPRKLINLLARSPKITLQEYTRAGLKYCQVKGSFRWANGSIEDVLWPVVGLEGSSLVYWNGEILVKKKHGKFIRSALKQEDREWPIVKVSGFCTVETLSFWFDGKKWHLAEPGDLVFGSIKAVSGKSPKIKADLERDKSLL